jgi:transposase
MANQLKMAIVQSILHLHALKWSQRRIARELGVDRETVRRHLQRCRNAANGGADGSKPAILPAGSECSKPATSAHLSGPVAESSAGAGPADQAGSSKPAILPTGSGEVWEGSNPANLPAGVSLETMAATASRGRPHGCEPFREIILAKLEQRLSAQRIHQDLRADHGFTGCYDSVKRYVRRLGQASPLPMRRMECDPGQEAQVDFGTGAPIVTADGRRRKTHVFRIVLSHSRKAYGEVTYRQTTEDFLRALENAFWHFGGVPETIVIDNLRAAVLHADWFDPELVPKLEAFCRHYGTTILPTRPRTPRHKGKIERGVGYVKSNALKGRTFTSLEEQNRHLADWEASVADTRIHGTTRQHVGRVFAQVERPALRPLPRQRFDSFQEAQRKVNRDGHVEVAKAYYSVPPEYLARSVWVRWDSQMVRVFNQRFEQIAVHARREPGRFSTHPQHIAPEKINGLERGAEYLLSQAAIGPHTRNWAEAMLVARGIQGTRVLQGLLALSRKEPRETLEKACEIALSYGLFQLRPLKKLLARQTAPPQTTLPFLEQHPIIRPLDAYAQVVAAAYERRQGFLRHDWAAECGGEEKPPEHKSPGGENHQGSLRDIHPPRPGYPLSSCTSAELDSVSPDVSSVVPPCPLHQENLHE